MALGLATTTAVNNSLPASPKSHPVSPSSLTSSPANFFCDDSIASILAASNPTSIETRQRQSTNDTPPVAHSLSPRPKLRDRDQSTHASFRPSSTSTKRPPPLPHAGGAETPRPKTSPSASAPRSPASPPSHPSPLGGAPTAPSFRRRASTTAEPLRSPFQPKRPPASHSCHGIETSSGPPPALSLRPPLTTAHTTGAIDVRRKATPPFWEHRSDKNEVNGTENAGTQALTPNALAQLEAVTQNKGEPAKTPARVQGRGRRKERGDSVATISVDEAARVKTRGRTGPESQNQTLKPMRVESSMAGDVKRVRKDYAGGDNTQGSRQSQSSGEDLFLNLAWADDDGSGGTNAGAARSKSKASAAAHRQTQSQSAVDIADRQSEHTVQADPKRSRTRQGSLQSTEYSDARTPSSVDRLLSKDRKYAASAHPLDQRPGSSRVSGGFSRSGFSQARALRARELSPEPPSLRSGSRVSGPNSQIFTPRATSRQQALLTNGHYHSSPIATTQTNSYVQEPSPPLQRQGTESTVSTTAPSTVWDELDDLKSRIRKLEVTGKIPGGASGTGNAGAATTAADRPRTATTTVTTVSSSPKGARGASSSPIASSAGLDESSPHPLLNSALAKSKPFVAPDTYQALETVTADALTLAKMTHSSTAHKSGSANAAATAAIDRQLKRKADALCRNLTELCITLSAASASTHDPDTTITNSKRRSIVGLRPLSRDASNTDSPAAAPSRFSRVRSLEPEQATPPPSASARVLSRLEARRTSLRASESPSGRSPSALITSTNTSATATPGGDESKSILPSRDAAPTPTQAALSRTSTVLGRIQRHALAAARDDGPNGSSGSGNFPHSPSYEQRLPSPDEPQPQRGPSLLAGRPLSRAMTELGRSRSTAAASSSLASRRQSREYYTSQHPLPERPRDEARLETPRQAPGEQHYLPQTPAPNRRSYLSRVSAGPTTLAQQRQYLESHGSDGSPGAHVLPQRASTQRQSRLSSMGGTFSSGRESVAGGGVLATRPERRSLVGGLGGVLRAERAERALTRQGIRGEERE